MYEGAWRLHAPPAKSSPDGCSANTLDNRPAEPAGTAPEPPPVVAKCSVMIGGQLVSSRRLLGRSGLKSDSAGSSWRPQLTQISAAPQTMAPVLQDKPRHSTDLAELCSLILWSAIFPFRSLCYAQWNISCHPGWSHPGKVRSGVTLSPASVGCGSNGWRGMVLT